MARKLRLQYAGAIYHVRFGLAAQGRPAEDGPGFVVEAGNEPSRSSGFAISWPWFLEIRQSKTL